MRKVLQAGLVVGAMATAAGCNLQTSSSSNPNTASLPNSSSSSSSSATTQSNAPEPGPFHGTDAENLGTITVPPNTILKWTCGGCSSSNFIIDNRVDDASQIGVNSLNQTSGHTVVDGGTYHDVKVTASGDWTITFEHG